MFGMANGAYHALANDTDESSLDLYQAFLNDEEQDIARLWSPFLYSLQRRAPKSKALEAKNEVFDRPSQMGLEYHGSISKAEAVESLLGTKEGTFLLRKKASGQYVVSFRFADEVKHYSINWDGICFLYGDKEFESVCDLVDDSLINLYLQKHNIGNYLTIGRAEQQQKFKRRKGLKHRTDEERQRLRNIRSSCTSKNSFTDDLVDGMSRETSPNGMTDEEPVQVFVKLDAGTPVEEAQDKKLKRVFKRKKVYLHKKDHLSLKERKSSPKSVVELLSINFSEGSSNLNKTKSISTGNLADPHPSGVIGMLVKNTLTLHSDEDLPNIDHHEISPASRSSSTSSYGKSHNFKTATYKGPTWCDMCHHFLWGLVQQGLLCQDCGINVHKQCMEDAQETDCIPTKKLIKRVFGVDLTTVVLIDDDTVPKFLQQCIFELESRGLDIEGIYRVSGRTSHVMEVKDKADENEMIDFSEYSEAHVIAGAIKLFLRELPIPLIAFDAYPYLLQCIKDSKSNETKYTTIMRQILIDHMPKAHYDTLKYFLHHLTRVVAHSSSNKMKSSNLAVVFAPTIMRSPNGDASVLTDFPLQQKTVQFLIDNFVTLFEP